MPVQLVNPKVISWRGYGYLYTVWYPSAIEAEVAEDGNLNGLIDEVVRFIQTENNPVEGSHKVFRYDSKIPYDNRVFDEETKTIAFVLLRETSLVGGMSWAEAMYVARVENGKVFIKAEYFGENSSVDGKYKDLYGHYRVMVDRIEKGVLYYRRRCVGETDFREVIFGISK